MRSILLLIILSATLSGGVWLSTTHDWVKLVCGVILLVVALMAYAFAIAPVENEPK